MTRHDVIVVGLGVAGSTIARALAQRGRRVLGLERHAPAHDLGSSAGESRMFRDAGSDPPDDVRRARDLWRALEHETATPLLLPTGSLRVAAPGRAPGPGRLLDAAALRRRLPALTWPDDARAALDDDAGILLTDPCLHALHTSATRAGADLRFGVNVALDTLLDRWRRDRTVDAGTTHHATTLVLALGPWATHLEPTLTVERVWNVWLDPGTLDLDPAHTPFLVWDDPTDAFCLFPALPRGLKVGFQHGLPTTPATLDRTVSPAERARARTELRTRTALDLPVRSSWVSMYTHTPDGAFLVTPAAPDCLLVSACSGRGFKLAPVLADRLAAQL